jgi:hypothetical protein
MLQVVSSIAKKKSPSYLRAGMLVKIYKPFYRLELPSYTTYELHTLLI